jgi:hypothetical protein
MKAVRLTKLPDVTKLHRIVALMNSGQDPFPQFRTVKPGELLPSRCSR